MDGRSYLYEESYKGSADKGKTQPGGYKFGMQRKDKKELQYDLKDLQVELGNLQDAAFLNVVVKVYCTHIAPDYSLPWQKQSSIQVLAGKVKVTRRGDDTKYVAKVLARGVDCDIALLSVESKEFWKEAKPLYLGHLPRLQEGEFMSMDFQMRHGKLIYLLSRCLLSFQNQP